MKTHWAVTAMILICAIPGATEAGTIVNAGYTNATFVIDGRIDEAGWGDANLYPSTFENHVTSRDADIYLAHDNIFLYVAMDTPLLSGWDAHAVLYIDGNHDGAMTGHPSGGPSYDIGVARASPGGWGGYNVYYHGDPLVNSAPAGYESASHLNGTVSYEFKFVIADLTDSLSNTLGVIFKIQDPVASKSTQYLFPATDLMKTSDPQWMAHNADIPGWADLNFVQSVPVPGAAWLGLSLLGVMAGLRRIRKSRRGC